MLATFDASNFWCYKYLDASFDASRFDAASIGMPLLMLATIDDSHFWCRKFLDTTCGARHFRRNNYLVATFDAIHFSC